MVPGFNRLISCWKIRGMHFMKWQHRAGLVTAAVPWHVALVVNDGKAGAGPVGSSGFSKALPGRLDLRKADSGRWHRLHWMDVGYFKAEWWIRVTEALGFGVGNSGRKGWRSHLRMWRSHSSLLTNNKDNPGELQNHSLCVFQNLSESWGCKETEMN